MCMEAKTLPVSGAVEESVLVGREDIEGSYFARQATICSQMNLIRKERRQKSPHVGFYMLLQRNSGKKVTPQGCPNLREYSQTFMFSHQKGIGQQDG